MLCTASECLFVNHLARGKVLNLSDIAIKQMPCIGVSDDILHVNIPDFMEIITRHENWFKKALHVKRQYFRPCGMKQHLNDGRCKL